MADPYSFTQPIRYYKSNDPYYYEVDNIPLRQLEENVLYIKDKIEGGDSGAQFLTNQSEINIHQIKQLKPKIVGGGRTVQVNAGRFIGRVNDAFNIDKPLANIIFGAGGPALPPNVLPTLDSAWTTAMRDEVWNAFTSTATDANAYNMNGMATYWLFHTTPGQGLGSNWGVTSQNLQFGGGPPSYPNYITSVFWQGALWPRQLNSTIAQVGDNVAGGPVTITAGALSNFHLKFVQMWRGVFRTAVVDMDDQQINVPAWRDDDFTYWDDSAASWENLDANQRIDLLVVYGMSVDSSSTHLQDYSLTFADPSVPQTPKKITVPTLGIVRGAGVGISKDTWSGQNRIQVNSDGQSGNFSPQFLDGEPKILGNISDSQPGANIGIRDINGSRVHGSFPSPDDLLNIAPILALDVDSDNLQLVGQAALPIAYIITRKGQSDLVETDIIDIRPFLRTTEFTYNERAGIAAANPPLSLANPAVGAFQLQGVVDSLQTGPGGGASQFTGKPLYTDYVMGGIAYGVEGTLLTMCDHNTQTQTDPFGSDTQNASWISPGNAATYNFLWATSSKAFMDHQNLPEKQALLEYFYNQRQGDLKSWLQDPNSNNQAATPKTYLGLPGGIDGRNIPLYPEWDLPVDLNNNYDEMINIPGGGNESPPATWWMWFEAINPARGMVYGPGGVYLRDSAYLNNNYLDQAFGLGWGDGDSGNGCVGRGTTCTVKKTLKIKLPPWVMDYDIITEYINCSPVGFTQTAAVQAEGASQTHYGMGNGLFVDKGSIINGEATVDIISTASPYPEGVDGFITSSGRLSDLSGTGTGDRKSKPAIDQLEWQWMAYTVCLPQFKQTKFNCLRQSEGVTQLTRFTPKLGAAFYPTVKFTVIGYDKVTTRENASYGSGNGFTLIQNTVVGPSNTMLDGLPPAPTGNAVVNLDTNTYT